MYRDAGVIFGQQSKAVLAHSATLAGAYERKMIAAWREFVKRSGAAAKEIKPLVTDMVNPYIGRKVEGTVGALDEVFVAA